MATAAAPTKYFTYAPGNAPTGKAGQQIKLGSGQALGFAPGQGYYAKPAAPTSPYAPPARPSAPPPPAPTDPLGALTPDQISKQADAQVQSQITPQQQEIQRQQALATANASADEDKITGLSTAAAKLMGELGPQAQQGFESAAQTEGSLGQGLATGVATDVASREAADTAFMKSQGQDGGTGPDTAALHDTVYDLNGRIPGDSFAEQGANAAKWGLAQAPVALNAGREELAQRMATAKTQNDTYAQQLIQLAATEPGLKAQALQQLNQYELDKANYRLNATQTAAQIANAKRQTDIQARSEKAQEKAAGLTATYHKAEINYKFASLQFQSQKEADKIKAQVSKGKVIDVGASKLLGHIVYKDGTQDPSVKVAQAGSSGNAAKVRAVSAARINAFKEATALLGKPMPAPKGSKGAYVARATGVPAGSKIPPAYPGGPATTNNIKYANRSGGASGYADAQAKVYAQIGGDNLIQFYGYSKQAVMSIVNQALARAGWKRK